MFSAVSVAAAIFSTAIWIHVNNREWVGCWHFSDDDDIVDNESKLKIENQFN